MDCLINCSVLFCNPEFEPKRWEGVVKDFGQTESVRLGVILRTKLQTLSIIRFYCPSELHSAFGQSTEKVRKSLSANALILAILPSAFDNSVPNETVFPISGLP